MESIKSKQNTSNSNIIALKSCRSSDSEPEKNKLNNTKLKQASSFDSENYPDSSLEVSHFSSDKSKENKSEKKSNSCENSKKLSLISENLNEENEEHNSSRIDCRETGSKNHLKELMESPRQNAEKTTNGLLSNINFSPIPWSKNKNKQQENNYYAKKTNVNERKELEVDDVNIRIISDQCICTNSSCLVF